MAQRIVTLCDVHQRNDEEAPGAPWTVTLQGPDIARATTWEVDLCEDDGKTFRDLAVMLDAVGRRVAGGKAKGGASAARASAPSSAPYHRSATSVEPPQNADGSYPCPVEGCDKAPIGHKALQSHLRAYHDGLSIAEAMGAPLPHQCPECDRAFSHPQGMGAHRRMVHGVRAARAS